MIPYPELLERLRLTKYPPELVRQHLRYGLEPGKVCGDCGCYLEAWLHSATERHPYCRMVNTWSKKWSAEWPACGKFSLRRDGNPLPHASNDSTPLDDCAEKDLSNAENS